MFGDLFEEEEESSSTATSTTTQSKGKVCEPPPPRGKLKLCGIRNQGSTCYLNSLLQTLLHTPEFREELFRLGPEELGNLEDKDKPVAKVRVIPLEMQNLFARLLLLDEQTTTTAALTESFGWTNHEETTQQDVQELNRILFSALESSLVGTSGSTLIQRLYHGTLINNITCNYCHNISERQEDFLDLTVCVGGVNSLEEALWSMFVAEEVFEGNNLYRCSHCDKLVTATKSAKLRKLPPFLTVSLLRFSFDFDKCERFKETRRYSFPLSINLRPFCEQSDQPDSELSYDLFSIIIHKGGCYGGHYHVYIKDIDQLGHWELREDDMKQKKQKVQVKSSSMSVCDSPVEKDDPLSVLTAVLAQESGSVLVDQLGQKLMEKIGCSWNKKYRKQYGPIRKFLQSNPDMFVLLVNASRVALRSPAQTPEQRAEPDFVAENAQDESEVGPDCGMGAEPVSGHWFDLNDSMVTAIRESDIIKQYEGKESAYMLFYRKHTLQRPRNAVGNPAFGVPPHLLQMVQEENAKLQQRRTEFEVSSNSVEIRLHFASHYCVENGALKLINTHTDTHTLTLSFDRRRTVGNLRLAVYQIQDAWEGDMALTIAKNLPAGLHLYDTLTDDQQPLCSAGVSNGSDLFVWNGTEVNGVCVQTGAEYEPLLLNILRPGGVEPGSAGMDGVDSKSDVSGLVRMMHGFGGGATLGGVRDALSLQEALVCQQAKEARPGGEGGGASKWKVYSPEAMRRTLRQLTLRDGDTLLLLPHTHLDNSVFSVSEDVVTVTTPSDCRWLQVELYTHTTQEENVMKIPAAGSTLLSEVKERALEEMQQHFTGGVCCLRQRDRTGKLLPPVREDLAVRDAGIKLMTSLCLCPGHAPKASQLFLFFSVAPPTGPELEIIVEETLTVKECLIAMLQEAGLNGMCWHLRRMDWCEEVGEPLLDENASLLEMGVVNGDTLVITEGQLPPKGFLKLAVSWLMELSDECERNYTAESQTTGLQSVGYIEISEEASLHELRCQVLTLPALVQVRVPSPEFLRVWLVEGKKLVRILRGNQLTLRKLKLSVQSAVCVQKLQCEENLGLKDILLRLCVGVTKAESADFPTHEFVWEPGLDSSPKGLYHAVSSHCGISIDNLLLAKHLTEQHTWITIDYGSVSKQKKKQNKSNSKGVNLQGAPYCLRDGDTIAVKNLLIDNNLEFGTVKNEEQIFREKTEPRGHNRRSEKKKKRNPEVSLSINVGVFR
ncbi:ubiquitin carboxyl-terminal hydrolase 40 isoform X2 [Silurus meridionalis]|uniref:ubiquitin carboxyl-terminal hydrolase 40 isoform X1 n=2 Tax=Silurus meridionalis TaxID=175797 RepID=UPI001EEB80F6|nr:ubiquitin carboxyl-terminal hydrolase 40 isoform X1 [Silurus meridionalis]XP_046717098.1 ubiquitin carboxyl-terminal hydrolase 40 isoform X2 [Silurus meridionalis]